MSEWLNSFSNSHVNEFEVIAAILAILGALAAVTRGLIAYFGPRNEAKPTAPNSGGRPFHSKPRLFSKILTTIAHTVRAVLGAFRKAILCGWRTFLYYLPSIEYELPPMPPTNDPYLGARLRDSAPLFSDRFAEAFPSVRDPVEYTRTTEIAHRLAILLRSPLTVWDKHGARGPTPVYWLGGLGNMHVTRWTQIKPRAFLMDVYELDIARIVAVPSAAYWQNFVYVECNASAPTGLYEIRPQEELVGLPARLPSYEEYCVYNCRKFTRPEFDDGGYELRGRVKQFKHEPQLRVRRIVRHNFLLVPALSPANRSAYDRALAHLLADCLRDPKAVDRLIDWYFSLPKREARGD